MNKKDELTDEFLKQIKNGKDLDSFLDELRKRGIQQILEGEMDAHLGYSKSERTDSSNARNGYQKKRLKTKSGEHEINVPRDRESTFEPVLVPKRKGIIDGIENIIISFYAKGMSVKDIERQIKDLYDIELSTSTISRITERIMEDVSTWQSRPLENLYMVVWMDGIVFKVKENMRVIEKTIYIAIGLNKKGLKEVLGLWLGRNESASFWMSVLSDLRA